MKLSKTYDRICDNYLLCYAVWCVFMAFTGGFRAAMQATLIVCGCELVKLWAKERDEKKAESKQPIDVPN